MDETFEAIYENGVFRPLTPPSLPEQTRVQVTVAPPARDDPEAVAKQKEAWRELFQQIDADPSASETEDGWSAANHDEVLYGDPDGLA